MLLNYFFATTTILLLIRNEFARASGITLGDVMMQRKAGFQAPAGPSLFQPFGEGPFDSYPDVPVLPPFGYPFPGAFPSAFAGPVPGPVPGPFPYAAPGPFPGSFPGPFLGPIPGTIAGPIPGPFASPFPGAYPLPLIAPPPAFPSPYYFSPGPAPAPPPPAASSSPLSTSTGPVIVSAKTAATLSLASIIHALIAKKFYPPIYPFPVPNPLPFAVPVRVPFPINSNRGSNAGPNYGRPYNKPHRRPEEFSRPINDVPLSFSEYELPAEIPPTSSRVQDKPLIIPLHESLTTHAEDATAIPELPFSALDKNDAVKKRI